MITVSVAPTSTILAMAVIPLLAGPNPVDIFAQPGLTGACTLSDHILGTDFLGRDTSARLSQATRVHIQPL